ncbi:glycosyltransferase family 2 protein [Halomarina pelagica]|uniref:glycosyltransferase family 2 protein n=1 Tax=Halomarina pelagica TaxID=2961599 RepID=UPI0020C42F87|nr:glycosyltransferase family 2 protein [Halomarina sp. BND7]
MIHRAVETLLVASGAFVLGYYLLVNGTYLLVHLAALFKLRDDLRDRRWGPMYQQFSSPFLPGVAVVVPAYNEAPVIVESVQSLLNLNYPDVEILVVNDGSDDGTLDRLASAFDLTALGSEPPLDVPTAPIRTVYRSRDADELLVLDKENGGKSDALNAGVWLTDQPLFCAIDADSIIERDGLLQVVQPFLEHPEETVATGGTVRVANGCRIERGQVHDAGLPSAALGRLQVVEYLRAFYAGRLGLDRLGGLLLISGAFGVFRTDVVREIGGYSTACVTEDFELVVRLHRRLVETGRSYRVHFVPEPVVWTEVPGTLSQLARQRARWYRGLVDTLWTHRTLFGNARYGRVGLFAVPAFLLVELLGPLIEGTGYVLVAVGLALGLVDPSFTATYLLVTIGLGLVLSWLGVYSEVWSFRRYDEPRQVLSLLAAGVLENFGYRQWKTFVAWRGLVEYLRGVESWGDLSRRGFE